MPKKESDGKKIINAVEMTLVFYKGGTSGFVFPKTEHNEKCNCPEERKYTLANRHGRNIREPQFAAHGNDYKFLRGTGAQVIPSIVANLDDLKWFHDQDEYQVVLGERNLTESLVTKYKGEFKAAVKLAKSWKVDSVNTPQKDGKGIYIIPFKKNNKPDKDKDKDKNKDEDK